jgi:VCBS repeat-containing protein
MKRLPSDTLIITVNNVAPLARVDSYSVDEDHVLTIAGPGVLANDLDAPGDSLTAVLVANATHGTVSLLDSGAFSYTPNGDFAGTDSFTYRALDDDGGVSANTVVNITVNPVNDAPSFTAGANETVLEDSGAHTIEAWGSNLSAGPADEASQALHFSLSNDNPTLFSQQPTIDAAGNLRYTSAPNAFGVANVTVQLVDNGGTARGGQDTSAAQSFSITVVGVNDAPVPLSLTLSADEDHSISGQLPAVDVDGDPLGFTLFIAPGQGSVNVASNGSFTYTPNLNFFGEDGFAFVVSDGTVTSENFGVVHITINPVNDAPVAVDNTYQAREDTPLVISQRTLGVLGNDTDVDDSQAALTAQLISSTTHGVLAFNPNGTFTYTPAHDFAGNDTFTYRSIDPHGVVSAPATVTLVVQNVNDAPVSSNSTLTTNEDTPASAAFQATDIDSPTLTFTVTSGPLHGVVQVVNGNYTYTPQADFSGSDSFSFRASDGQLSSNTATVSIAVTAVNDAPVALNGVLTTNEDTQASGSLHATDVDSSTLTYSVTSGPQHGVVQLLDNGNYTYTPQADFFGSDSFTFKASDGALLSDAATLAITVNPVNDAPRAVNGTVSTAEDTPVSGTLNAVDVDGDTLTFTVTQAPLHGVVQLLSNGSFTYTPQADYFGSDSFSFRARDGQLDSNVATVSIAVSPVNDAPVAQADVYSVNEDSTLQTEAANGVLRNDRDVDSAVLTAAVVTGPAHGAVQFLDNGSFNYTPAANFLRIDTFTYQASDGGPPFSRHHGHHQRRPDSRCTSAGTAGARKDRYRGHPVHVHADCNRRRSAGRCPDFQSALRTEQCDHQRADRLVELDP